MIEYSKFNQKNQRNCEVAKIETQYIMYELKRTEVLLRVCDNQVKYTTTVHVFFHIRKIFTKLRMRVLEEYLVNICIQICNLFLSLSVLHYQGRWSDSEDRGANRN